VLERLTHRKTCRAMYNDPLIIAVYPAKQAIYTTLSAFFSWNSKYLTLMAMLEEAK
jgi:hypothetical protein